MTQSERAKRLTYVENLERENAELRERLDLASKRIAALISATTEFGKPLPVLPPARLGDVSPGLARMASGMKLPADIKPTTCPKIPSTIPANDTSPNAAPAGILRMAAGLKLPRA